MDTAETRFISRLTRSTVALVLAGGKGSRLHELTQWRAKPSVHFGGKFRIIDFPLSNCINSGLRRVGVLTQYKAHSLIQHLVHGWSRFSLGSKEFVEVLPASQRVGGEWYRGTADAVFQNLDIIRTHDPELVLILAGDHVYKMDYGPLLAAHAESGADMTVCCLEVPIEEAAGQYGVMTVDETGKIIAFDEKPANPSPVPGKEGVCLASMGNYVFNTDFLYEQVIKDSDDPESAHDFGHNIIPSIIKNCAVYAYPFRDLETGAQAYWRDIGTLDAFWEANMELIEVAPQLDMYDKNWPIMTHQKNYPAAKFVFDEEDQRGEAIDSMISGGCIVSGTRVKRSLLFSNCRIDARGTVKDSLLLPDVKIGRNCRIERAILDRGAVIPDDSVIGVDPDEDRRRGFRITPKGITLVTPDMLGQKLHFTR